jgi:spore germination cell wall hydrolase CwlJ-like protein
MRKNAIIFGSISIIVVIAILFSVAAYDDNTQTENEKSQKEDYTALVFPKNTTLYEDLAKHQKTQIDCLAKNIYYEARSEPRIGWMGVASVTMNRLLSGNYSDTVCGVVYQRRGNTYQFSWVGIKNRFAKINNEVYNDILQVATAVYLAYDPKKHDVTYGSTFYHAEYVYPKWKLERAVQIGRHIFYTHQRDLESI